MKKYFSSWRVNFIILTSKCYIAIFIYILISLYIWIEIFEILSKKKLSLLLSSIYIIRKLWINLSFFNIVFHSHNLKNGNIFLTNMALSFYHITYQANKLKKLFQASYLLYKHYQIRNWTQISFKAGTILKIIHLF
jgi:hypothetical protein